MVSYKLDKYDKYFVAFILVVINIVSFCNCVNATETNSSDLEQVYFTHVDDISMSILTNKIVSSEFYDTYYIELEKGYTYTVNLNYIADDRIGYTDSLELNSDVYNITYFQSDGSIQITINGDNNYLFFAFTNMTEHGEPTYSIYKQRNINLDFAVDSLVKNVGPQQLWSVFESGIDFISVVVLVAFGLFLIVLLIKKLSKGKRDF